MEQIFNVLAHDIDSLCKEYKKYITEDIIRFLFIKALCKTYKVPTENICMEKPYLFKRDVLSQEELERKGIIDENSNLRSWLSKNSRIRLDLFFSKDDSVYCIEFKHLKYGKGWAPDTCFGGAINDLHRLSLLKKYNVNYHCYFLYAFDEISKKYLKDKYSCSSFCFIKPEQTLMSAIDVIKEIEGSKEIKKNSLNSFPNEKTNIKFSKKFKDTITAGINYKIIKRFSKNDFNLVLLEVLENSNSGF